MIKKLVSYILSKRRARKLVALRTLHKMQSQNRVEHAIRVCERAMDIVYEPTVRGRILARIAVKSPSYIVLYRELEAVRDAVLAASGDAKYITPPEWVLFSQREESVDSYFVTETDYIGVKPAIAALISLLKEINDGIKADFNSKFVEFYNSKPHRLYTEVIDVMIGVSENV